MQKKCEFSANELQQEIKNIQKESCGQKNKLEKLLKREQDKLSHSKKTTKTQESALLQIPIHQYYNRQDLIAYLTEMEYQATLNYNIEIIQNHLYDIK